MNRISRMLTMTGIGVFAAVSVGAGQAMATTGGSQTPAKPAAPAAKVQPARSHIIDIYSSYGSCVYAGRLGERLGDWDDFVCVRTGGGFALEVSFDNWSDFNNWDNHNWHGPWGIHGIGGNIRGIGGGFRGGNIRGGNIRGGNIRGGNIRGGNIRGGNIRGGNIFGAIPVGPGGVPAPGTVSIP